MIGAIVDTDALLQVLWVSVLTGVGVTGSYALAILGAARALEFARDGRVAEAAVYAVIGVAGMATFVAAIVFGIVILVGE
jgi:hypothetical protein